MTKPQRNLLLTAVASTVAISSGLYIGQKEEEATQISHFGGEVSTVADSLEDNDELMLALPDLICPAKARIVPPEFNGNLVIRCSNLASPWVYRYFFTDTRGKPAFEFGFCERRQTEDGDVNCNPMTLRANKYRTFSRVAQDLETIQTVAIIEQVLDPNFNP